MLQTSRGPWGLSRPSSSWAVACDVPPCLSETPPRVSRAAVAAGSADIAEKMLVAGLHLNEAADARQVCL